MRIKRSKLKQELQAVQEYHTGQCTYDKTLAKLNKIHDIEIYVIPDKDDIAELYSQISEINKSLTQLKEKLKSVFCGTNPHRSLRPEAVNDRTTIAVFESFLTRTLGLKIDEYSDALIVVRVYFYEIFKDLVLNGFDYNGSHYVVLTASAGQIRTKKCVFIKEELLKKHSNTIMCGLTVEHINECGGCNTNKYLAYLALANSATEEWKEFDIDRCIVVDDMETLVRGMVDYIDDKTYSITRQEMDIPINHTDGCGMVLPRLTGGKNTMFRMPWVKGLLASFAFDDFVHEANFDGGWNFGIIKDIYGKPHDIIAEKIEVILSKSMFKMHRYYSDWDHYKRCYKQYGCSAGLCNFEEDRINNASIGYQMLQSLTDLTDDELIKLSAQTRYKLEHISSDRKVMLKCLGATPGNPNKSPAQECLLLYPELLQDEYYREELRNMRASIEKWAWAGKLDIFAKYLFLIPDLFAFCEFLFLGNKNPTGLLADGEVYAAQFPSAEKLDCLRSPSLYREHPVRINKVNDEKCFRWFSERGLYTSCHDLISKIIQNDFDGDTSLVCAERTLVDAAERHMQDVVPLYYEMRKAKAQQISMQSIYDGMAAAYSGGNIGPISNSISKIWNSDVPDLDTIKRLCYRNNEVID